MSEIVSCIDRLFSFQPIIDVGITTDLSLPPVICVEGHLGISIASTKQLFAFALTGLGKLTASLRNSNNDNTATITNTNINVNSSSTTTYNTITSNAIEIASLSRALLLVKADNVMALNFRKQLVQLGLIPLADELHLSSLSLHLHPKHANSWHHRRWCLARTTKFELAPSSEGCWGLGSQEMQDEELALCHLVAHNCPKNYYTWIHRLWVLQFMDEKQVSFV